ncbi:MAG: hypothetical protein QXQ02_04760 [Halobacteria archaeon]
MMNYENFLFTGGETTNKIWKLETQNLTIEQMVDFGGSVEAIAITQNHVYAGGSQGVIKKYDKDLEFLTQSSNYGGVIKAIVEDDLYIYAAGLTTQTINKYLKSNLALVAQSPNFGAGILQLAVDDTYIYACGVDFTVKRYLKTNLSYAGQTPSYGAYTLSIALDSQYLYVGGSGEVGKIKRYLKSDLSFVDESPSTGGAINAIIVDDYVYAAGEAGDIKRYLKSDLSFDIASPSYGGIIKSLTIDGSYIYAGGETTRRVRKYQKSNLSFIIESANYGDTILVCRLRSYDTISALKNVAAQPVLEKVLKATFSLAQILEGLGKSTIGSLSTLETELQSSVASTTDLISTEWNFWTDAWNVNLESYSSSFGVASQTLFESEESVTFAAATNLAVLWLETVAVASNLEDTAFSPIASHTELQVETSFSFACLSILESIKVRTTGASSILEKTAPSTFAAAANLRLSKGQRDTLAASSKQTYAFDIIDKSKQIWGRFSGPPPSD